MILEGAPAPRAPWFLRQCCHDNYYTVPTNYPSGTSKANLTYKSILLFTHQAHSQKIKLVDFLHKIVEWYTSNYTHIIYTGSISCHFIN